jgi:hypothetical protein
LLRVRLILRGFRFGFRGLGGLLGFGQVDDLVERGEREREREERGKKE